MRADGFGVDPPDIRQTLLERSDGRLAAEQLEETAAGIDWTLVKIAAGVAVVPQPSVSESGLSDDRRMRSDE